MATGPGRLAAAGTLAVFLFSAAFAGGPVTESPAPVADAATVDWSGYYAGISVGRPTGDTTWDLPPLALSLVPDNWGGTLPALNVGRDWQRGRLTFGAAFSLSSGELTAAPQSDVFFSCFQCNTIVSDLLTLRGRAGLATGRMLYFATGGIARADVVGTRSSGVTTINSDTLTGWTLGLGVERRLAEKISISASYDHTDLGSISFDAHVPGTVADIDFGLMQIGVNYRW